MDDPSWRTESWMVFREVVFKIIIIDYYQFKNTNDDRFNQKLVYKLSHI